MMNTQFRFKSKMSVLLLLAPLIGAALCSMAHANVDEPLKWESLTDTDQVKALTYELDECITLAPLTPPDILNTTDYEKKKMQPAYRYAWLIDMIVERANQTKARPQAVALMLAKLNTLADIKNKDAVRSLLYVALNLAGGDAPESELLDLLDDPATFSQIKYRILGSMLHSQRPKVGATLEQPYADDMPRLVYTPDLPARVPLRALPILLRLVDDPWENNFYSGHSASSRLVRVYPVREMAYACLLELGVKAEKVLVPDTELDEKGKRKLPKTVIQVDRASADKKLRELESQESSIKVEERSPTKPK